jgi:hypothetical protein
MRAAAVLATSIVAVGIYLAIAAVFAFSTALIGLGVLLIGVLGAVAMMVQASIPASRPAA